MVTAAADGGPRSIRPRRGTTALTGATAQRQPGRAGGSEVSVTERVAGADVGDGDARRAHRGSGRMSAGFGLGVPAVAARRGAGAGAATIQRSGVPGPSAATTPRWPASEHRVLGGHLDLDPRRARYAALIELTSDAIAASRAASSTARGGRRGRHRPSSSTVSAW